MLEAVSFVFVLPKHMICECLYRQPLMSVLNKVIPELVLGKTFFSFLKYKHLNSLMQEQLTVS